tara:strand:+ start:283 stop:615 length:333 start_codon:yes stop_codon:yes gene_type:complete
MAGGILNKVFGNLKGSGLIQKGAAMMGFNMPGWAGTAIEAGRNIFGGGDTGSGDGVISRGRHTQAADLGTSKMGTEQMVGVGEQKASAAVEYEDELREMVAAIRLYAESE